MLILGVTSSTGVIGAAVGRGRETLGFEQLETDRQHAEELVPMIKRVLASGGVELSQVEGLTVDIGPGRFTGLRVGITTVRALALALELKIATATSLELLGCQPGSVQTGSAKPDDKHSGSVMSVIDARRAEVFYQRFVDGKPVTAPTVGSPQESAAVCQEGDVIVGDGADRYAEVFKTECLSATVEIGQAPRADSLVILAAGRPLIPGPTAEPLYLREPDVQVNVKTRHS